MDNNNPGFSPVATAPQKPKISSKHHLIYGLVSLIILIAGMAAVYLWQHHKVNSLNAQVSNMQMVLIKDAHTSLDKLNALMALPNIVVDSANSPTDLVAFLGSDNTGCYKGGGKGYYKVISQANNFAEMQYGCTAKGGTTPLGSTPAHILAKKTGSSWSLISPTNQWLPINNQDVPSCAMVNSNKVSKAVTPNCWQGPALGGPSSTTTRTVVPVTNP